jgi:hypothetical protein
MLYYATGICIKRHETLFNGVPGPGTVHFYQIISGLKLPVPENRYNFANESVDTFKTHKFNKNFKKLTPTFYSRGLKGPFNSASTLPSLFCPTLAETACRAGDWYLHTGIPE